MTNPWLSIPAADYEGHMGPGGADQLAPRAAIFAEVYQAIRPSSLALLGCATGNGLQAVDATVTGRIVGVDVNAEYLAIARQRYAGLGEALDLRCADLLTCELGGAELALMTKADLVAYRQMLVEVRDRVGKQIAAKKSAEEIKAAKPLADLDARWGQGFVNADFVIDVVVKTHPPAPPAAEKGQGKQKR